MTPGTKTNSPEENSAVVHLLKATKIPAGYQKLIRVRIDKELEAGLLLFTPGVLKEEGVILADGVVTKEGEQSVRLVVENHSHDEVRLGKGVRLGTVTGVEVVQSLDSGTLIAEGNT